MKKVLLASFLLLIYAVGSQAQTYRALRAYNSSTGEKGIYFPTEWYNSNSSTSGEYNGGGIYYSMDRKVESTNFVIFWDKEYGSTAPNQLASSDFFYVDLNNLLEKAEEYYALYAGTMGFVNPTTSTTMSKFKCMICIMHSETWGAYGSGYDYVVPALWINPATCKPVGHTIAHEIGHSFHYMAFAESNNHQESTTDNTGFHLACGNGQAIWEQTAQFQAATAEPSAMFTESYPLFGNNANYAFSHEWMRYQSYWFHFYLNQYYNDPAFVGKVWNQPMKNQQNGSATDFCQAYIKLKGLTAAQFYERYFDYALHCATFDFDAAAARPDRDNYIGKFDYHAVMLGANKYQVAYQSCPQSTGFNVIELSVPSSGTTITTKFTALQHGCSLADGDPALYNNGEANASVSAGVTNYNNAGTASYRGFRVGYVFLKSNGTREYYNDNTVHCTGTAVATENISTTVPANTSRIFLVVSPALTTYVKHPWQEDITKDDQWPYQFELENVTAKSVTPIIQEPEFTKAIDGRSISDVTLTYNVVLPPTDGYDGATVTFTGSGLNALCTAFQMEGDNIFNNAVGYASSQSNESIMNYAVAANGNLQSAASNTNGDFGHWFNASGTVVDWGNSTVAYAEFTKSTKSAVIGQYPGASSDGQTRTIREALVYKKSDTETATAYLIFNITFQSGLTSGYAYLSDIDYTEPEKTYTVTYSGRTVAQGAGFEVVSGAEVTKNSNTSLTTRQTITTDNASNYITASPISGYKVSIRVNGTSINITYTSLIVTPTSSNTKPTSTTNLSSTSSGISTAITIEQGGEAQESISISAMKTALNNTSNDFETSFTTASNFNDYARLSTSMSTSKFYYYAFNTAPLTTNFSYYATSSNKNDADMGDGVYTHYYLVTEENTFGVIATADKDLASFKIGYDPTNAKFIIQVADDCPAGTYSNVRLGIAVRKSSGGSKYYCGYVTFDITVTQPLITHMEETLNVERYPGMGYTTNQAEVDFTAAKTFLGVTEVTTDMLRIINPDETQISDYAQYDGWFNGEGAATTWGDNTKINVKFFEAINGGTYSICDMNGADVVGTTYTVKWALTANGKTYTYNINVTFVERPVAEITLDDLTQIGNDITIDIHSTLGSYYEGMTSTVDVASILSRLSVSSLDDVTIYAVQSNGTLDDNYMLGGTDGWRNASGDWQSWGDDAYFYVKANFTTSDNQLYDIGGMIGKNTTTPAPTYTATYAIVKNGSSTHDAVILKVNLIYEVGNVTLADDAVSYETDDVIHNVTLQRSLPTGKWLTFCAPFDIEADKWTDMGISEVRKLGSVTRNGNSITLNFIEETAAISVGIPVIIMMSESKTGITKQETLYHPDSEKPTIELQSTDETLTVQYVGTYVKMPLPNDIYYVQDNNFRHTNYTGDAVTNMKGFRGYFVITDHTQTSGVKEIGMTFDDQDVAPTDIEGMEVIVNDRVDVYTLTGTKVKNSVLRSMATENLPAGIYIVGGKKLFVK
ncbi:MAG: DUF6055 domain-containing protein [Bacteroidales bacterium]|nr:DUF6055 domain-containing protein [Bacteroidales bacterium]